MKVVKKMVKEVEERGNKVMGRRKAPAGYESTCLRECGRMVMERRCKKGKEG